MADSTNTTTRQLTDFELKELALTEQGTLPIGVGLKPIVAHNGQWCSKLTQQGFELLPDGSTVIDVLSGEYLSKGRDAIDINPHNTHSAFALPLDDTTAQWLDERYPNARSHRR